ncbi:MAG: hypothetical protein LBT21_08065 [Oscillospiraceae bacterium]|nr:hypothetical protein [Oscillospiraceae bacterium]
MKHFQRLCTALAVLLAAGFVAFAVYPAPANALLSYVLPEAKISGSEGVQIVVQVFDSYLEEDAALQSGIDFMAISPQGLPELTDAEREEITAHFEEKLGVEVLWATHDDLIAQGRAEEMFIPRGVLFSFNAPPNGIGVIITVDGVKYRSGLGADFFTSTLKFSGGQWVLDSTFMTAIS